MIRQHGSRRWISIAACAHNKDDNKEHEDSLLPTDTGPWVFALCANLDFLITRLKQTTVKWALQEFISIAARKIEMDIAKHQVSFCDKEEIDIKYIVSRLQVGPVQSSIIFRNNSNYYQSCFSFFSFQHEEMFDKAIIYNLREFTQKFNDRNFINSKMLLELNNTINLSLFSYRQKVKRIFFQSPPDGACSTKICTVQGDGVIIYEVMQGNIERDVKNARAFVWCFYALTAMTLSAVFLFIILLHL